MYMHVEAAKGRYSLRKMLEYLLSGFKLSEALMSEFLISESLVSEYLMSDFLAKCLKPFIIWNMKNEPTTIIHPIPPTYDRNSRVLILGSFPSIKSREMMYFYGHPQNRFWKVVAALYQEPVPMTVPERHDFLIRCRIAAWDSIGQCSIVGSSDSSIKDVIPNDLSPILETAPIEKICCNGRKSWEMYHKYIEPDTGRSAILLPSTSPANAACSLEKLIDAWRVILP